MESNGYLALLAWSVRTRYAWRALLLTAIIVGLAVADPTGAVAVASEQERTSQPERGEHQLWRPIGQAALGMPVETRRIASGRYHTSRLDHRKLLDLLAQVPLEQTDDAQKIEVVMELPWPDGSFKRFAIEESPIMEPELASQFSDLKTYRGHGLDDVTASVRFDWTPSGLHAMVLSGEGTVFIDPLRRGIYRTTSHTTGATTGEWAPSLSAAPSQTRT